MGLKSTDQNGYRKALRDKLRHDAWEVNMVGTKSDGTMADNDHEGTSGYIITQVRAAAKGSMMFKPNVVLINAGTNDCRLDVDVDNAGARMRDLILDLFGSPDMGDTLVVLSTLLQSTNAKIKANQPNVNKQYRNLVKTMQDEGYNIVLADMDPPSDSPGFNFINANEVFADDTHPNDEGYRRMATVWYQTIAAALAEDRIHTATDIELGSSDNSCEKTPGNGVYAGGKTQRGSGEDDGSYAHSSEAQGIMFSFDSKDDNDLKVFFGRLYSRDRDDILIWEKNDGIARYNTYRNTGNTANMFTKVGWTSVDDNCNETGAHFIDINGDGLDDFVCIALDGTAYASVNNGDGTSTSPPTFTSLGKWKDREGYDQARVRLGDVDGDGRADYCVLMSNGDIRCWRNGWIDDLPAYWQGLGIRFTGKGMGDLRGVRFEDINGDGRDDWVWVDTDGQTTTWTNSRSCVRGKNGGDGLNIVWRQGFQEGKTSGPTHPGMGSFADAGLRNRVHFARVIGAPQDFGLLGRQDYAFFDIKEKDDGGYRWDLHVWKNTGHGATKIKADGNRYCNMQGHSDGRMDYVWILSKGDMRLYPNKGLETFSDNTESYWGASSIIFDPRSVFGRDLDRRDLHLADWDGDGACDIVWTDPDNNNQVHLWRNRIKETGDYNWEYHGAPAPALNCPERRGLGFFDRPVHMADITGNGMADYLCVEPNGRTWGYVQNEAGWEYMDQIKFAEGKDRANLQWADVNGDGLADLIHTNKFTGTGTVWYNQGRKDIGGSRFHWVNKGEAYAGVSQGSCTYFPDLNGDGRADMHAITHSLDNTAESWYNMCGGKDHTGDDGAIDDPNLPTISQVCDPDDFNLPLSSPRPVSYWDSAMDVLQNQGSPYGRQYINIVNLTPYTFRYLRDQSHYYQMDEFNFDDIPAGSSRQCVMDYNDGAGYLVPEDDKGEAYFEVANTPYTFAILARTHYGSVFTKRTIVDLRGWNMGVREFEQPGPQGSVNLVITGSESYGFHSNINLETSGPVAWMHHIRDSLSDRKLKHVIMPGSHDSGMNQISQSWLGIGANTQTQGLNMYEQLKVGTRFFDMRVVRLDDLKFWTAHVNDEMANHNMVGGAGMAWDDVISGLNSFMDDFPGEVVIIKIRYMVDLLEKLKEDKYWDDDTMEIFFETITRINKRCPNLKKPIPDVLMGKLQGENNGGGCVLLFSDARYADKGNDGVRVADYDKGIYNIDDLQIHDIWSDSNDPKHISEHQRNQYHKIRVSSGGNNSFHVSQWLATAGMTGDSIEHYALFQTGGIMYSDGVNGMDLVSFPTVLMTDYVGVRLRAHFEEPDWGWEHKTLAMGLNLLLVSSNCGLTHRKHPFYPLVKSRVMAVESAASKWNGAILADGTTLDNPPAGFNPWKESVLRAGTVFANGTVLLHDMMVPVEW